MAERKTRQGTATTGRNTRTKKPIAPTPIPLPLSDDELYNRVAQRAYDLFMQRGAVHGHDVEDWLTAERLVREGLRPAPPPNPVAAREG
jgi:hypothetical protein